MADEDEVNVTDLVDGLDFLGSDDTPSITNNYQENAGSDGSIFTTASINKNIFNANFSLHFSDWYDLKLAKHDIYRLFIQKKLMRLRSDAEPAKVSFARATPFDIKPFQDGAHDATFSIPFENPSGYKFSLLRSDSLYTRDEAGWQRGMNLPNGEDLIYRHTVPQFKIFNASDIPIDPYYQRHDLKIIVKFKGNSLQLVNKTNGTSWKYNKSSNGSDLIVLDGINTTLNGTPASANTDYGNLILEKGWNDIVATGATTVDITFSFPFIYIG
ncbi:hypothetical protein FC19_GL001434 [Liquorilactobacillus aquaticus DSM 21051]|uniref:Siphovirus-type tail component RIFT-related domain-containing protein n=1 Tax=Liquorilactobacillus aquaticus DSM 21051 TaxID=1423725 RepID=A0A0R2CVS0_9LACO|nr:phage tail domain-containing protein [Liquorilactobacillus aquaticus]KRM95953.1 hypothetical protein FC19_GL001434 [Liquorilactobacillus aquaticus DSM 21051]